MLVSFQSCVYFAYKLTHFAIINVDKASIEHTFKEYELVTESENYVEQEVEKTEKQNYEEYEEFLKRQHSGKVKKIY